ncbi:tetratricopeptide repeat protein [Amedibacillus sp. YH-ame6]
MKVNTEKLSVSNERLSIIGRLIGIYREERRDNSQNSWTQKRFCKDICSPNTLKNIEAGGLSRSIEIYVEMLDKFDLKLGEFPEIDKAVYRLTEELYEATEDYNLEKIIGLSNKILRILNEVSDYIYYSELKELFENIKNHYGNKMMIKDEVIEKYKQLLSVSPDCFKDMIRLLVYLKIKANSVADKNLYKRLVEDINLINCSHEFVKINLIDFYYIMGNYKKMELLINNLIKYFQGKRRFIRLLDAYNYAIVLFSELEFEKCLQYIKESEAIVSENILPETKVSEYYTNVAYAYHLNEQYENALNYYYKGLQQEHRDFIDSYMFMADCQNRLNLPIDIPFVDEDVYVQYPIDVKYMYKYFTFDNSVPDFVKENYILKKIVPLLTDPEYIKVFRYEILRLVNKSGHYKCTYMFESLVEKNIKK